MGAFAFLGLGACATSPVPTTGPEHGDAWDLVQHELIREAKMHVDASPPLVVKVDKMGLSAFDPVTGVEQWRHDYGVTGHLVASTSFIFVPFDGNRVARIDRRTGDVEWQLQLADEILVGMDATDHMLVVTTAGGQDHRRRITMYNVQEGVLRWDRGVDGVVGVPALVGKDVFVPVGGQLVVLDNAFAKERARAKLPEGHVWRTITERDGVAVATGNGGFVDLSRRDARPFDAVGAVFAGEEYGHDPGFDDQETLGSWVPYENQAGQGPTRAVLLTRRAVMQVQLDETGVPANVDWVHRISRGTEYVSMKVTDRQVQLMAGDGSVVVLDESGQAVGGMPADRVTLGGLFVEVEQFAPYVPVFAQGATISGTEGLRALMEDQDIRLLRAHQVALGVLWRSGDQEDRGLVQAYARGEVEMAVARLGTACGAAASLAMSASPEPATSVAAAR